MKVIIYFGNYGSTAKVGELLKEELKADLYDGTKKNHIDFSLYDMVIFGYNIRMGKPNKQFLKYYKKFNKKYNKLKVSAYIVGADQNKKGEYLATAERLFPPFTRLKFVGGILDDARAKGLTKRILRNCINDFINKDLPLPILDNNGIKEFARDLAVSEE